MVEFKNEQERFNAYFKEISKCIMDLTLDIVDSNTNATILNVIELLLKVEMIEDRSKRILFLQSFKEGFKEEHQKQVKEKFEKYEKKEGVS